MHFIQQTLNKPGYRYATLCSLYPILLVLWLAYHPDPVQAKTIHRQHKNLAQHATTRIPFRSISLSGLSSAPYHLTFTQDGALWFTVEAGNILGHRTQDGKLSLLPLNNTNVLDLTPGSDHNFWFSDYVENSIGRVTPQGVVNTFPLQGFSALPGPMVAGPDGNLWFVAGDIGRITPQGSITRYPLAGITPTNNPIEAVKSLTLGPDGNLWFVTDHNLGALTIKGQIAYFHHFNEYDQGDLQVGGCLGNIAVGPGQTLWISHEAISYGLSGTDVSDFIQINPSSGKLTETHIDTGDSFCTLPPQMLIGPDGNFWYVSDQANIGNITPQQFGGSFQSPAGLNQLIVGPDKHFWFTTHSQNTLGFFSPPPPILIQTYSLPTPQSGPQDIVEGPDGNLWFTETKSGKIGRITPTGTISEFPLPSAQSQPLKIIAGADNNLWFTENAGNSIGRITPQGQITEYSLPTPNSAPQDITIDGAGNLWFTESNANQLGRLSADGTLREFRIPTPHSHPYGIEFFQGQIWFTENASNLLSLLSPQGLFREYQLPKNLKQPASLYQALPDDGDCLLSNTVLAAACTFGFPLLDYYALPFQIISIAPIEINNTYDWFIDAQTHTIGQAQSLWSLSIGQPYLEYPIPGSNNDPTTLTVTNSGDVWFTEYNGNKIGHASLWSEEPLGS